VIEGAQVADYFREAFQHLKLTAEGLIQASEGINQALEGMRRAQEGLVRANQGIVQASESALAAKNEHEDLRETVHRLEALVIQQGHEIRQLREALGR
jgi:hypothetical protein